ncbi:MAG: KorB domain-containing protein [Francisella endosymbiont of Hyalomma asiaticum]
MRIFVICQIERGIIQDVRTLYELKKFAEEIPQVPKSLSKKALENKISGSYRSAITRYRDNWKRKA